MSEQAINASSSTAGNADSVMAAAGDFTGRGVDSASEDHILSSSSPPIKIIVHSLAILQMEPEFRYMVEIFGGRLIYRTEEIKNQSGKAKLPGFPKEIEII